MDLWKVRSAAKKSAGKPQASTRDKALGALASLKARELQAIDGDLGATKGGNASEKQRELGEERPQGCRRRDNQCNGGPVPQKGRVHELALLNFGEDGCGNSLLAFQNELVTLDHVCSLLNSL